MLAHKSWKYFLVFILCFGAYIATKHYFKTVLVEKKISYTTTASEVFIVWGLTSGSIPNTNLWPPDSHLDDEMIYTKMVADGKQFTTRLALPAETNIYYWLVQTKDKNGNATDIWDSGGDDKESYKLTFNYNGYFKPGYFIFLAGFVPLLMLFYDDQKRKTAAKIIAGTFHIKDYIPQFDSLRAIAVLLVIVHHWVPENSILNYTPNGPLGVNIFFVLSGFLITGILLKSKKQVETHGLARKTVFRNCM